MRYPPRLGRFRCIPHPSATRRQVLLPALPFDLHVLGMPPAFNLSQDQTLQLKLLHPRGQISFEERTKPRTTVDRFLLGTPCITWVDSSTTRRPHKSPAHTVKDRSPRPDVSSSRPKGPEGAAHYIRRSGTVNTRESVRSGIDQLHSREPALAQLEHVLAARGEHELAVFHHAAVDSDSAFVDLA